MRSRLIIGVEQSHGLYYPGSGAFVLRKAVCKLGIISYKQTRVEL